MRTEVAEAQRLGINQAALAWLELGEHNPTMATLERLAGALGVCFRIEIDGQELRLEAVDPQQVAAV